MKNWNYINGAEIGNEIPNSQINGPSAAEIREIAGRVYKTDMRKDDLARAVSFELAKKYKSFQTNSHIMDMVSEVLSKFKVSNAECGNRASYKPGDEVTVRLPGKGARRALVVRDEGNVIKVAFSEEGPEITALPSEVSNSKVGNSMGKDIYQHKLDPNQYMVVDWDKDTVTIIVNGAVRDVIKSTDKVAYAVSHVYKKVNSMNKTGNETMREWATSKPRNVGNTLRVDGYKFKCSLGEYNELKSELEKHRGMYRDKNGKGYLYEVSYEIRPDMGGYYGYLTYAGRGDNPDYSARMTTKLPSDFKKVGNAKVINSDREFFKELADDAKEREDKDNQEVEKLVENSKVGNVASEYEILKQDPSKMHPLYKKAYEEAMKKLAREDEEFKKRFEKEYGVKSKNEASDDKFAYVMREFDEGKLKTPDGKVVTDPAQAKAIAYSESKKAENGLTRARNSMAGNWNSDRNISPVGAYKEFITNLKNAIELGVAAVTYNIDGSTLKTWVEQAKKEGYGSHISGVQGQKVILK